MEEKTTGKLAISLTETLAKQGIELSPADAHYGYEQIVGGAGRAITKFANTVYGFSTGDLPAVSEFPFVSRFYREKLEDEIFDAEANQAVRQLFTEDRRERFYLTKKAEEELEKMAELTSKEKREKFIDIARENEELAEKMLDIAESESLGLKGVDKQLKRAPVDVRAQYIANEIKKLGTNAEKKKLLKEYAKKKILTEKVLEQVLLLLTP